MEKLLQLKMNSVTLDRLRAALKIKQKDLKSKGVYVTTAQVLRGILVSWTKKTEEKHGSL